MPNGKPGDHPLTDIFRHGLDVYGHEVDAMLREISALTPQQQFVQWWEQEIGPESDQQVVADKVRARLAKARPTQG